MPRSTGQALVKDHRLILNLKEGDNVVRFSDVAATIDPTSVRFLSTTDPVGTQVVEQNFEYDLVNADGLLKRYIDKEITCIGRDGAETTGFLAAYDSENIVLASAPPDPERKTPRETQILPRRTLQAVRLKEVPADLLVKPTLVWKLRAAKAGQARHHGELPVRLREVERRLRRRRHAGSGGPARPARPDRLGDARQRQRHHLREGRLEADRRRRQPRPRPLGRSSSQLEMLESELTG